MSAPTSDFSKLSITSKMEPPQLPFKRTQSGSKGKERAQAEDESSGSEDESSEEHVLALDHCRQHGAKYAFQIADAEIRICSVRISATDTEQPTCSCGERGICRHIIWLVKGLARTNTEVVGQANIVPSTLVLRDVCEELQWELRGEPDFDGGSDPDSDDETETQWKLKKDYSASRQSRQAAQLKERARIVRDIMASFSPSPTDDFRKDIFEKPHDFTIERVLAPYDLEETISRFLLRNDDMFHEFKSLVSSDDRATDYFKKMSVKARESLDLLDKYCDLGPTGAGGKYDVIWCAQKLVDIVDAIGSNVTERQPLGPRPRQEAAKALVSILEMVVKERNHDEYQNIKWSRRRPHGEMQIDRNLYQRLIGSSSPRNPSGGNFVITALQDLPEASAFVDDLEDLWSMLGSVGWGAPRAYLDRLITLITKLKGGSGPSSSSGKRSAGPLDRNAKRMK